MSSLEPIELLLRNFLTFLSGLAGVGFTIAFVIYGFKPAGSAGNPAARANSISGLWWTGLGALVSFGASFIVSILSDLTSEVSSGIFFIL